MISFKTILAPYHTHFEILLPSFFVPLHNKRKKLFMKGEGKGILITKESPFHSLRQKVQTAKYNFKRYF